MSLRDLVVEERSYKLGVKDGLEAMRSTARKLKEKYQRGYKAGYKGGLHKTSEIDRLTLSKADLVRQNRKLKKEVRLLTWREKNLEGIRLTLLSKVKETRATAETVRQDTLQDILTTYKQVTGKTTDLFIEMLERKL